jgi:hypothetical protein
MTAPAPVSESEVAVVVRGLTRAGLRQQAVAACERRLGGRCRFADEQYCPCMVSIGGRVRLWEGRFRAVRAD